MRAVMRSTSLHPFKSLRKTLNLAPSPLSPRSTEIASSRACATDRSRRGSSNQHFISLLPMRSVLRFEPMLDHWEQSLIDIEYLDPAVPKKLMPRLNQLVNRAQLTPEEIHILRGVAKAMSLAAKRPKA